MDLLNIGMTIKKYTIYKIIIFKAEREEWMKVDG